MNTKHSNHSTGYKYPKPPPLDVNILRLMMHEHMTHYAHIQQHIHQHQHHYLTYMHSPTISPSFNIYALININYITTTQQLHTISHNPGKGESQSYYDKHRVQHLSINHTSSYNHINLFTKDFEGIRS